ncbi:uncharacterized protein LOC119077267 [Bradysia coprophila]|uniref:uncharacterized protein LOC119077267 n=1 Tax=Bradysia coprophila TaxID=38358 RepID=UPI00187D7C9F|nr:uncharacterized protein LOC119077267 [Bradysia coprophila]
MDDNTTTNQNHHRILGPYTSSNTIGNVNNECSYRIINYNVPVPGQSGNGIRFRVDWPEMNFTGRTTDLHDLKQFFSAAPPSTAPSIAVVSGMGGIGKTQFVRKFIDENQSKYANIVWIDSENNETIIDSFKRLLDDILDVRTKNANGNEKDAKSIIEQVLQKLCYRKTLFVYDNVESTKSINFVLRVAPPTGEKPHIVITSRLQKWPDGIKVIQLKVWKMAESIEFISEMCQDSEKDSEEDKIALAEILQHFPLALRQATAFINQQRETDDFPISEYINRYNDNACEMLASEICEECSINPYQKTTYTTWDITIEAIKADKRHGQLAIKIFKMIAYFAADDIKRDFFHRTEVGDVSQQAGYEVDLKSAVNLLVKYCMIDSRDKQRIFSIHRVVQDVTKFKSKAAHEEEPTLRDALKLISKWIVEANANQGMERVIPLHSISVFMSAIKLPDLMKEFVPLALDMLHLLVNCSVYDQALEFGETIIGPLIDIFGPNDGLLLEIQHYMARVYLGSLMFDQALQMNLDTFNKRKIHFGPEAINTLNSQSQVADSYEALGDDENALHWYKELLEKQKIVLDENHPDMLETMCKIATSLKELGRHDEALQLYEEVLVKRKTLFAPTLLPQFTVEANIIYILKQIGNRELKLRTHPDCFNHFTGWIISDRKQPASLVEKQNLRKGFFTHLSSSRKQFIHTHTTTSTFYHHPLSVYELLQRRTE